MDSKQDSRWDVFQSNKVIQARLYLLGATRQKYNDFKILFYSIII
jgi:hypothetical protein